MCYITMNLFSIISFICVGVFATSSPQPVDKLDVAKYLGKWFQIYGAPTNMIFQGYGKCITAEYGLLPDGNDLRVASSVGDTPAFLLRTLRNPTGLLLPLRPSGFSSSACSTRVTLGFGACVVSEILLFFFLVRGLSHIYA